MVNIRQQVYGHGKTVVLLHGWAMHSGVWLEFAQNLADSYRVICLDLPGHGFSSDIKPYTLDKISTALISSLPKTKFCILGWSLGALFAITIAKKIPQQVQSLILLASNPKFVQTYNWHGLRAELLENFAIQLLTNYRLTLSHFLSLQFQGLPDSKKYLTILKQAIYAINPPTLIALQGGLDILRQADLRYDLQNSTCPISVIQGDKDAIVPIKVCADMLKIQPNAKYHIIANAGHAPFLSHKPQVIKIIKSFL